MDALKADAAKKQELTDKRHAEVMELLLKLSKHSNSPTPVSSSSSGQVPPIANNSTTNIPATQPPQFATLQSVASQPSPPPTRPPSMFYQPMITTQQIPLYRSPPIMQSAPSLLTSMPQNTRSFFPTNDRRYPFTSYPGETWLENFEESDPSVVVVEGGSSRNARAQIPMRATSWDMNYQDHRNHPGGQVNHPFPVGSRGYGGERIPEADYRLRKLKMPLFDGEDAFGWIYKVERFFEVQGLNTSGEKLRAAVLCLEGPVLVWYRSKEERTPFRIWEELKLHLLERFQPSHEGNL